MTEKQNIVKLNEANVRNAINYNQPELSYDVPMEASDTSSSSPTNLSPANIWPSPALSPVDF